MLNMSSRKIAGRSDGAGSSGEKVGAGGDERARVNANIPKIIDMLAATNQSIHNSMIYLNSMTVESTGKLSSVLVSSKNVVSDKTVDRVRRLFIRNIHLMANTSSSTSSSSTSSETA